MSVTTDQPTRELSITRILDAPRDLVWTAWTKEKHMAAWWGPNGFTNPVCRMDVQPKGRIYLEMKGPDGMIHPMSGQFLEVVKPERLVFISTPLDKDGKPLFEIRNTILFMDQDGKTKLTVSASVLKETPEAAPYLAGMDEGWRQTLERLEKHVMKMKNSTNSIA